jgi:hypothetical protein
LPFLNSFLDDSLPLNQGDYFLKQKSHKVTPMAFKMKKPWGLRGHPWLSILISGEALWVTPTKIKIKEIAKKSLHKFTLYNLKHIKS